MKLLCVIPFILLMSAPAKAQDEQGQSLMEQGAELFFEGLRQQMQPTLDSFLGMADEVGPSLLSFFEEMGPALADLAAQVQDWSVYEAPEMLPNGDIVIRKKPKDQPEDLTPQEDPSDGFTDI